MKVKSSIILTMTMIVFMTLMGAIMTRPPVVSGQFYPSERKSLSKKVDDFIKHAFVPRIPGHIFGIVVPHAGYSYSGLTAAHAYKAVCEYDINTVILLGPTHRVLLKEFAMYGKGLWQTPLGEIKIDESFAQAIAKQYTKVKNLPEAHAQEHSLEVQLPFLQRIYEDFKIVPIMMLEPTYEECLELAQVIAKIAKDKKVLIIASSDLYHGESYAECKKTDSLTLSYLKKFDPLGLYKALKTKKAHACGGYPIVVTMLASQLLGANKVSVLCETNSNEVTQEIGGYCVGYAASILYKSSDKFYNQTEDTIEFTLTEKKELIRIARTTLIDYINTNISPTFKPLTPKLNEKYGVFVTLKKKGELRGCIGYVEGIKPLYQGICDMAIAASTEDPRFPRVQKNELKDIAIEITVMTPLKRITNVDEIIIGKHGLVIKRGSRQGLLLPQIATEQGWTRETFLKHTCWKAGLSQDAWQEKDIEIYVFSGTIISEE